MWSCLSLLILWKLGGPGVSEEEGGQPVSSDFP